MEGHCIRYCRICGSDILVSDEFCAKCGGNQTLRSKGSSTSRVVLLVVAGLFGTILLGIVSAVALPRLASGRTKDCNTVAYRNIVSAKQAMDRYFLSTGAYPDTVEQMRFKSDEGVSVNLIKAGDRMCTLVVMHVNGSKEYVACSGESDIYCRNRNVPESQFMAVR